MAFVYLVRNGVLHKIGRTDNLEMRLSQLAPGRSSSRLKPIAVEILIRSFPAGELGS